MIMERSGVRSVLDEPPMSVGMYLVCSCCNANVMRWWGSGTEAVMFCTYCDRLQFMQGDWL